MAGPPSPPPGFVMDGAPPPSRSTPAPPPGYRLDGPTGQVHDGDTLKLRGGQNARLYGVDAFELAQYGTINGKPVPLGVRARNELRSRVSRQTIVRGTGTQSYRRPVVTLDAGGKDVGNDLIATGYALPAPAYLLADPKRRDNYVKTQRHAIAAERGAYAGTYQLPADYRKQGSKAPTRGKIAMTGQQAREYDALLRNPKTTPEQLSAWAAKQGQKLTNAGNILSFMRRNPKAGISHVFQQQDVLGEPVLKDGPGITTRILAALNEGIPDFLGGPVDIVNMGLGALGVPVSDKPILGSEHIRSGMHSLGIGQTDESYAPRSSGERYGQAFARGTGQSILPIAGTVGLGNRMILQGGKVVSSSPALTAIRNSVIEAAKKPGVLAAGELGSGIGSQLGGQVADDVAPGNPWAQMAGQIIGGVGGGIGAGSLTSRTPKRPYVSAPERPVIPQAAPVESVPPPPPPQGFVLDSADGIRLRDVIDVNANRARPLSQSPSEAQMRAASERVKPSDMLPIPSNEVGSIQEAAAIDAGRYAPVRAVDESSVLQSRALPSPVDASRTLPKRGPLDLATWLRTRGGVQDQGGELSHIGIDNRSRDLDFARGEARFGNIVSDKGMTLDDAAQAAWDAGYFPQHSQRPTIPEFLDALDNTQRGTVRAFRPDDLPEVDAFNAARDQRYAVEKARQEGAPLVEDRSLPANEADVAGNQPPVSAYEEWPDGGPDFAGNIRLSNLETPQDIRRALVQTHNRVGFDAATRGRVSHAETERLASELGMTPDQLLSRRKGQALNAEEALAARQILAKSGNELVNLARRVQRMDDPGEEVLAAFRQAWVRHVAIQEQVEGMTAEAGRTLQQFRMMADSTKVRGNVLGAISESAGGRDRLKKAADLILEGSTDPAQLNANARNAMKPKLMDKVNELWINSLLSGPQTHVVNMMSNTLTSLAQIPEHGAAASLGLVRSLAKRSDISDRILFSELGARSAGLIQGTKEGLRQFVRTMKTGEASDFANKVEAINQEAISGLKGKIIRTPTRMLSAEDELFKGMARRMELSGLAVRKARAEGLKGDAARKRAAELLANPTDDMLEQAFDYGRYITFQRPLGPAARNISMFAQNMPGMKFILPFVRTPTNLLKFALERSPAAPLVDSWRADFRAGGAKRDLAIARAMVGTGVGALVADLASKGMITADGPADEGAKELLRADGWQPYSIRIGDKYYSYSRLDPFASTLGVAAGMVELQDYMTEKQKDRVALLVTASIMQNLSSKTWLSGIGSLVEAVNDPARYADSFIERLAGSAAVPAGVAQVARTVDPTLREAESILDAVKQRVPFVSKSLPARRDVWGQPIAGEGGFGPDIVSPVWTSTRRNDPINNELLRLGTNVGQPRREVGGVRLNADQWGQYRALTGQIGRSSISDLLATPEWQQLRVDDKQDAISDTLAEARKRAREQLFSSPVPPPPPGFTIDPPPAGYVLDR